MTVKIDEFEPNIFPHVDDLDARDAGRHVEMFLDVRIEGKPPGQNGQVRSLFVAQLDSNHDWFAFNLNVKENVHISPRIPRVEIIYMWKDVWLNAIDLHCHDWPLVFARTRVHRSEVMFSMLVIVLCRDRIAILRFSAGKLQISLIA